MGRCDPRLIGENRNGCDHPREDQAGSQLPGAGAPTLIPRVDAVADHAGDLFRLHPAGRLCPQVPGPAPGNGRDDHRHPDRPVRHRLGVRAYRHLCQQGQRPLRRPDPPYRRGGPVMKKRFCVLAAAFLVGPTLVFAAGPVDGGPKQAVNWVAIGMFVAFVALTLAITYWGGKGRGRPPTSIPPAAASPASRTASPSPATTCRRRRSSASPAWSTPQATM